MSNGFDLSAQKAAAESEDQGTVVHIHGIDEKPLFYRDANGDEKPVTITVAGTHSRRYRRIEEAIRRRPFKPKKLTAETFYEDNIEKVAACTLAWEGFFYDGQPLEFTRHNIEQLYRSCAWVLDQVVEAMNDHARFFLNSSPTQ